MGGPEELPKIESPDWLAGDGGAGDDGGGDDGGGDFSEIELAVIDEARTILESPEFEQIRAAHEAGEVLIVEIDGRIIQYEPGLPASGMTLFGENGFLMGREAFRNEEEPKKTVLHELYRLKTSEAASGVGGELAQQETQATFDFAERAVKEL